MYETTALGTECLGLNFHARLAVGQEQTFGHLPVTYPINGSHHKRFYHISARPFPYVVLPSPAMRAWHSFMPVKCLFIVGGYWRRFVRFVASLWHHNKQALTT